jgi:hypothetical protein
VAAVDDIDLTDLAVFEHGAPHEAYGRLRDGAPLHRHARRRTRPAARGSGA